MMKSFFSYDKFNVTLCLEYTSTNFFHPKLPPPPPPLLLFPSPSYLNLVEFYLDTYNQLIAIQCVIEKQQHCTYYYIEHVVICILEKGIQETKSVLQHFLYIVPSQ